MAWWRRAIRLPAMIALLFLGLAITLVLFPFQNRRTHRRVISWWSGLLLAASGVVVQAQRDPQAPEWQAVGVNQGYLLLANHLSWLDIFVINRCSTARFVAKSEIRRWPLIGLLVARTGTLFLERGRRRAVHHMLHEIAAHIETPDLVAVFPEGTTSDGQHLLPFHGNLIQAAISTGAPILPVGLTYHEPDPANARQAGALSDVALFIGSTTFVESVWQIIGHPRLIAKVQVLAPIVPAAGVQRHEIADAARAAISLATGLATEDTVPEGLRASRA